MHEASIAYELLNIATNECTKNGYIKIESIKITIGRATGIVPQALLFAFNALKEGTAANANLIIEETPVRGVCNECGREFETNESYIIFTCPHCESFSVSLTSGKELNIIELEVS